MLLLSMSIMQIHKEGKLFSFKVIGVILGW